MQANAVRFCSIHATGARGGPGASQDATADLTQWARASCAAVPASAYDTATAQTDGAARGGFGQALQLYDCAGS